MSRAARPALKRSLDIGLGLALLALLGGPGLLVALALVCCCDGPVFYRHERVGRGGRRFACLKFRTMLPGAEQLLARVIESDPVACAQWQAHFRLPGDPRITPLGRWLRRTGLDELPQLFNVLAGQMSLVGPRPVTAEELSLHYGAAAAHYLSVRPGLTGAWQVHGRSHADCSYADRVALDVDYVRHARLRDDLRLLGATPWALLRSGARQPARPAPRAAQAYRALDRAAA